MTESFIDHWTTNDGKPIPFACHSRDSVGSNGNVSLCKYGQNGLICGDCEVSVADLVPVFVSSDTEINRLDFYKGHYSDRSRLRDLEAGYLARERKILLELVSAESIAGIVLEIGCGTGVLADISANYVGMDFSPSALFAEGFQNLRRFAGDAQQIPLMDKSVQMVISFFTLEHVPEPALSFAEIDRLLTEGGIAMLHPAWNCTSYNTRFVPVLPYRELPLSDRIVKILLPVIKSMPFKLLTRIPYRLIRSCMNFKRRNIPLKFRRLTPSLDPERFIPDCDATASIDPFDVFLYFESRGYKSLSHKSYFSKLFAKHSAIILKKTL